MPNAVVDGALLKPGRVCTNINQSEILQNKIFTLKLTIYFQIDNLFVF